MSRVHRARAPTPQRRTRTTSPRTRSAGSARRATWTPSSTRPSYLEAQKKKQEEEAKKQRRRFPEQPQRDVLQFLIEHAPLEHWQRDVLEIVRDEAYYFAPQAMTKIMNEGWASYWHSKILTEKALTAAEIIDYADANAGRARDVAGPAQPVQARRRALPQHRGALEQGPVRQGVGRVRLDGRRSATGTAAPAWAARRSSRSASSTTTSRSSTSSSRSSSASSRSSTRSASRSARATGRS